MTLTRRCASQHWGAHPGGAVARLVGEGPSMAFSGARLYHGRAQFVTTEGGLCLPLFSCQWNT